MRTGEKVQAIILGADKILLIKRYDYHNRKKPLWRLVKGGIEKNESIKHALRREIKEEVQLKKIEISKKIHEYYYIDPRKIKMKVHCYLVFADKNEKIIPDKKEMIIGFRWTSLRQAYKLLGYKEEKEAIKKLLHHAPLHKK